MKKVINGKIYNTETAELIAEDYNECYIDDSCYELEEIYRTNTGKWFLHYAYGPNAFLRENYTNGKNHVEGIEAMTEDRVKMWLEERDETEKIKKYFPLTPLHHLSKILQMLNMAYDGPVINFPIERLVKPIISFRILKDMLIINIDVNRNSFETGYIEEVEEERQKKYFDKAVKYEKREVIVLKTLQDEKMAEYILKLNYLPCTHWSFSQVAATVLFEGFECFELSLEDGLEPFKRGWLAKPENIAALRKKKIKSTFAKQTGSEIE